MFLNAVKLFFAKRILKIQHLSNKTSTNLAKNRSIGVLMNLDEVANIEGVLDKIKSEFPSDYQIDVLVFKNSVSKKEVLLFKTFSFHDFNIFASSKTAHVTQFIAQDFHVLINYFKKPAVPLLLVAHQSKARTKVGFFDEIQSDNVLMINTDLKEVDLFVTTLKKYLTVTKII
jgi:hypothetical protein